MATHEGSAPDAARQSLRPGGGIGRTLGQLVAAKMALVAVCRRCKHRRVLYPANLIPNLRRDFPAIELRQRLRCTGCRGRMANLHEFVALDRSTSAGKL